MIRHSVSSCCVVSPSVSVVSGWPGLTYFLLTSQTQLNCPLPSPLTLPVPRLVISVSVYIVFVFCLVFYQFVFCDVPLKVTCLSSNVSCPPYGMFVILASVYFYVDLYFAFVATLLFVPFV